MLCHVYTRLLRLCCNIWHNDISSAVIYAWQWRSLQAGRLPRRSTSLSWRIYQRRWRVVHMRGRMTTSCRSYFVRRTLSPGRLTKIVSSQLSFDSYHGNDDNDCVSKWLTDIVSILFPPAFVYYLPPFLHPLLCSLSSLALPLPTLSQCPPSPFPFSSVSPCVAMLW